MGRDGEAAAPPRGRRRPTHLERHRELHRPRRQAAIVEPLEEQLDRSGRDVRARLHHGRQGRRDVGAEGDAVEPHDGQITRMTRPAAWAALRAPRAIRSFSANTALGRLRGPAGAP